MSFPFNYKPDRRIGRLALIENLLIINHKYRRWKYYFVAGNCVNNP
jgi:hypothetical protein